MEVVFIFVSDMLVNLFADNQIFQFKTPSYFFIMKKEIRKKNEMVVRRNCSVVLLELRLPF